MVDENRLTSIARRMLSPNREDLPAIGKIYQKVIGLEFLL